MSEMVERVSRALCSSFQGIDPDKPLAFKGVDPDVIYLGEPLWKGMLPIARTIIAAMREPTEYMMNYPRSHAGVPACGNEEYGNVWRLMIDGAVDQEQV